MLIATFSPRLCLMFAVNVWNRGCPAKTASSGKKRDFVTFPFGFGGNGGLVKFGHPNLFQKKQKILPSVSIPCILRL